MNDMQQPTPAGDPVHGHNAIAALTAYYSDLVNFVVQRGQQANQQLQAQLAQEKDAHMKTRLELEAKLSDALGHNDQLKKVIEYTDVEAKPA